MQNLINKLCVTTSMTILLPINKTLDGMVLTEAGELRMYLPGLTDRIDVAVTPHRVFVDEEGINRYFTRIGLKICEHPYVPSEPNYLILESHINLLRDRGVPLTIDQGLLLLKADLKDGDCIVKVKRVSASVLKPFEERIKRTYSRQWREKKHFADFYMEYLSDTHRMDYE